MPPELYSDTRPSGPSLTTTRLGTVWPGVKSRLDVGGWAPPLG
jgi:hypothetical protein